MCAQKKMAWAKVCVCCELTLLRCPLTKVFPVQCVREVWRDIQQGEPAGTPLGTGQEERRHLSGQKSQVADILVTLSHIFYNILLKK
jgi:hypothetical protein